MKHIVFNQCLIITHAQTGVQMHIVYTSIVPTFFLFFKIHQLHQFSTILKLFKVPISLLGFLGESPNSQNPEISHFYQPAGYPPWEHPAALRGEEIGSARQPGTEPDPHLHVRGHCKSAPATSSS